LSFFQLVLHEFLKIHPQNFLVACNRVLLRLSLHQKKVEYHQKSLSPLLFLISPQNCSISATPMFLV